MIQHKDTLTHEGFEGLQQTFEQMSETAGLATSSPAMDLQDQTTWTTHEEATLQAISRTVEDQERRESSRRTCHSRDSPA